MMIGTATLVTDLEYT